MASTSPDDSHSSVAELIKQIGDLPDQELSMRLIQVYRRTEAEWELVHRHADPLTRPLSTDQLRSLAER